MDELTTQYYIDNGYRIENARIASVDISMEDHGCITFDLGLDGKGWRVTFGGLLFRSRLSRSRRNFFLTAPLAV